MQEGGHFDWKQQIDSSARAKAIKKVINSIKKQHETAESKRLFELKKDTIEKYQELLQPFCQ